MSIQFSFEGSAFSCIGRYSYAFSFARIPDEGQDTYGSSNVSCVSLCFMLSLRLQTLTLQ